LTGGLIADWSIVNTVNAAAWGGQAVALTATTTDRLLANTNMNVLYAPQIGTALSMANVTAWSADPLFLQANTDTVVYNMTTQNLASPSGVAPVFAAGYYDLPDLSTANNATLNATNNAVQIQAITDALAQRSSIFNEYAVESAINGATDWVFSMPTRRYSVAMAYANITATNDGRVWNRFLNNNNAAPTNAAGGPQAVVSNQFGLVNTSIVGNLICVNGNRPTAYDREERTNTTTTAVVVSPSTVAGGVKLCGEASVLAFNNGAVSAAVNGTIGVSAADVGFSAGWATLSVAAGSHQTVGTVAAAAKNYPITGGAFQRAAFGAQKTEPLVRGRRGSAIPIRVATVLRITLAT